MFVGCLIQNCGCPRFRESDESTGKKHDQEKNRLDLIDWSFVKAMGEVLTLGAKTYGDANWVNVDSKRYEAALMRHCVDYMTGNKADKDSGLSTLAHVAVNAMFLAWFDKQANE